MILLGGTIKRRDVSTLLNDFYESLNCDNTDDYKTKFLLKSKIENRAKKSKMKKVENLTLDYGLGFPDGFYF